MYITTPIYYVNSDPHIGHAYTTIVADIFSRFHKIFKSQSWFLTGTDEHGDKILKQAQIEQMTPQKFTDKISQKFRTAWSELDIEYDQFIRTTDSDHKRIVQEALNYIYDHGYVYKNDYTGLYCFGCERYLDQTDLDSQGLCPDHQVAPEEISESNYFFKMSQFQDQLIQYIHDHPGFIYPNNYKQEVLGFLREPLKDLCISRPKSRLTWGIEIPFDKDYVTYVWFDALLNYVSALGGPKAKNFEKYWPSAHHFLGKDIVKTHCVYWPCMLMALDIALPKKFVIHGFWNVNASKMSKSLGNVVSPLDLKEKFGTDALRYYLAAAMSFGQDADFTQDLFVERYNADLANNFGNLVSRTLTLINKNFDSQVPACHQLTEVELNLKSDFENLFEKLKGYVFDFQLNQITVLIMKMTHLVNRYIDDHEPWKLAKNLESREDLARILNIQCTCLRFIAGVLYPFMPKVSQRVLEAIGEESVEPNLDFFDWQPLPKGRKVKKIPPLFPRVKT